VSLNTVSPSPNDTSPCDARSSMNASSAGTIAAHLPSADMLPDPSSTISM
jgi:hypothetical protein